MKEIDILYEGIMTTQDIICTNCKVNDTLCNVDDYEAADRFRSIGWRATRYNIYCPKCAKKKLKQK